MHGPACENWPAIGDHPFAILRVAPARQIGRPERLARRGREPEQPRIGAHGEQRRPRHPDRRSRADVPRPAPPAVSPVERQHEPRLIAGEHGHARHHRIARNIRDFRHGRAAPSAAQRVGPDPPTVHRAHAHDLARGEGQHGERPADRRARAAEIARAARGPRRPPAQIAGRRVEPEAGVVARHDDDQPAIHRRRSAHGRTQIAPPQHFAGRRRQCERLAETGRRDDPPVSRREPAAEAVRRILALGRDARAPDARSA